MGAVPTPAFIVATYADGRPGYMVIDSKTGSVTERSLPVSDGMKVPVAEIGSIKHIIGPAVLEGDAGALAISAYFANTDTVPDGWGLGFPFPEKAYLFGIDMETGDVAWQIEGIGNWREDLRWPLQYIWFDDSTVIWTGGYGSKFIRSWGTGTGNVRWSRNVSEGVSWACVGRSGVVVREGDSVLKFLEAKTGQVRWTYDPGSWEMYSMFFLGDTFIVGTSGPSKSISGIRVFDRSTIFKLASLPGSYRICGVQDGGLILELPGTEGSGTVRIDPETGVQAVFGSTDPAGSWNLEASRYLLSLRKSRSGFQQGDRQDLFKAEGEIQLLNRYVYPVQTFGSLGEVTAEGSIIVTSYDDKAGVYRVYLLRRK